MRDTLVIVPTYNEARNVGPIAWEILRVLPAAELLVVDDRSPDGTADEVRVLQSEFPGRVHLEVRDGLRGLGRAYVHGFRWGLARDYAFLAGMDADFSHAPADLPRLRAACEAGADLAVGSRYVPGGGVEDWAWHRRALSRGASWYTQAILGGGVKDPTAGFVFYRREALAAIDLGAIRFVGYAFQIEMKHAVRRSGRRIIEVPIRFVDRKVGRSKMNLRIFHEALWGVWWLRLCR
jgi:dolichol-phosphate mannosyltransferase